MVQISKPSEVRLLDACLFSSFGDCISELLYDGPQNVGYENIAKQFNAIGILATLEGTRTIREVHVEVGRFLNIINQQVSFNYPLVGRKSSRRKANGTMSVEEREESLENLRKLEDLTRRVYEEIRHLKNKGDPREKFDFDQRNLYQTTLEMLDRSFPETNESYEALNTDNKLIATAMAISLHNPCTILTRDGGILSKTQKICKRIGAIRTYLATQGINLPLGNYSARARFLNLPSN